jgi:hypothetical protein
MHLTTAQLTTLKNDIQNDGSLSSQPNNSDGNTAIAAAYNALVSPDFWAWRTSVTKREYVQTTSQDGTNWTWVTNGFITRSVGEQTAWRELFEPEGVANPSLANVRQAITDILSGTGNAALNRTHLLTVSRRKVTRFERLYTTGTGSTVSPAVMAVEGPVDASHVQDARNLP